MTRSISIAAVALSLGFAAAPAALAAGCPSWICGDNGTHLTGVRLQGIAPDGAQPHASRDESIRQPVEAERMSVEALTLPTGETVDLR
jgi:hypothetical protein